jgi:hypothetical protein
LTSRTTARFRQAFALLPERVRVQAREAHRRFQLDAAHPGLRLKLVHPSLPIYSVRVGLGYRALGRRDGDVWIWFWLGAHGEYDRLLKQM